MVIIRAWDYLSRDISAQLLIQKPWVTVSSLSGIIINAYPPWPNWEANPRRTSASGTHYSSFREPYSLLLTPINYLCIVNCNVFMKRHLLWNGFGHDIIARVIRVRKSSILCYHKPVSMCVYVLMKTIVVLGPKPSALEHRSLGSNAQALMSQQSRRLGSIGSCATRDVYQVCDGGARYRPWSPLTKPAWAAFFRANG